MQFSDFNLSKCADGLLPVIVQVSALADTVVPAFIVVTAITQVSNGSTSRARICWMPS